MTNENSNTGANRDSIKAKIAKLLNMTAEHGASEAEAIMALNMANNLMAENDIQLTEVNVKNSKSIKGGCNFKVYGTTRLGEGFSMAIAELCDCKVWRDCNEGKLIYFGLTHDVEIANYLFDMLSNTISVEIDKYKRSELFLNAKNGGVNGKSLVRSFISGIERRVDSKIRQLITDKKRAVQSTGTALVVLKNQVVDKDFKDLGMKLRTKTVSRAIRSEGAFNAGQSAGDGIEINRGIPGAAQGRIS